MSFSNKSSAFQLFCSFSDVTGLVETKDCEDFPDNKFADLRSFNVFRKPRNCHGGGVAIIGRRNLKMFRRTDLESENSKLLLVESAINI